MKKLKSPTEKLPCLLLTTFLLVLSTNYFCSVKDNFISKNMKVASAETITNIKNDISLPVSAKLINPSNETNFTLPISRNPFRLSSNVILDTVNSEIKDNNMDYSSNNAQSLSTSNNYVAMPNYPILNGTVISAQKSSIIALYNGKSDYYELGDKIGPYELKSIEDDSIVVSKNGENKTIRLGEKTNVSPNVKDKIPNSLDQKSILPSISENLNNNQQLLTQTKNNLQTIGRKTNVSGGTIQSSKIM